MVQYASQMVDIALNLKCETVSIQWDELPIYSLFSINRDGSHPKLKVSKVSCVSLADSKQYHVNQDVGNRIFRLHII